MTFDNHRETKIVTEFEKRELVGKVLYWFHSYDFGDGVAVQGHKSLDQLQREWDLLRLPDLTGKRVLDINTWDGWFALQAERRGASQVIGLDWYMWSMDQVEHSKYWLQNKAAGTIPKPYHEMPYFRPTELPGKIGFDTARQLNSSRVEEVVGDFATMNLDPLRGQFDIVLYLGTLYHMADPIGNLRRLYEVTAPGGLAVIETQASEINGLENVPLCESYGPLHSLNADSSNWWSPNAMALRQMLLVVGFESVELTVSPAPQGAPTIRKRDALRALLPKSLRNLVAASQVQPSIRPYRAYAHAHRSAERTTRPNPVPSALCS